MDRIPVAAGRGIKISAIQTSLKDSTSLADNIITSEGLADIDSDGLLEFVTDTRSMWLSEKTLPTDKIELHLPQTYKLGLIKVWNYNQIQRTQKGLKTADISIWNPFDGWKRIFDDFEFEKAEGSNDYDEPVAIRLNAIEAQNIRFDDMKNHSNTDQIGLGRIQLFEVRGPKAFDPSPENEITFGGSSDLSLKWTSGLDAVKHNLYLGTEPDNLKLIQADLPHSTRTLQDMQRNTKYFWRVDEVKQDNSIQTGNLWSFTLTGGLVSHWKLDESQGKIAHDSAGDKNGLLSGKNLWSSDGKIDGALKFDGDKNDVAISDLNLNTNTITITAWVHQMNSANNLSAIVFWRDGDGPVGGLNFYFNHELRYHWTHKTWTWSSGLTVPHDRWAFIAMVIEPQKATLYVHDGNEMKSATNNLIHPPQSFDGTTYLARDINWPKRSFKGMLDDIRIYNYSLTKTQIESICNNKDIK